MLLPHFAIRMLLVVLMASGAGVISGQDYPNKPIRIVTGTAGGNSDFVSRLLAKGISGPLGQPVIVENRSDAVIAVEVVTKAPSDGYTLHFNGSILWTYPLLQKAPYDVVRDFSLIVQIEKQISIFVVNPSLPVKSISELIAYAKARPGELNYASGATGGSTHLGLELFKYLAGVNIVRVPYKGPAPAIAAVMSGEVQLTINNPGVVIPHVKTGKLRALAVTSLEPSPLVPGVPTVAASGLPGYEVVGATGLFAPAKTPKAIINRLNQEVQRFLLTEDAKQKFLAAGIETLGGSPEQFTAVMKSDIARFGKMIRDTGIKAD